MSSPQTGLLTPRVTPNSKDEATFSSRVSPVFHPEALLDPSCAPNLVVLSSDSVLFYAHSKTLLYVSRNAFSGLLPASPAKSLGLNLSVVRVQNDSTVLDLILHAIYGLDMAARKPSLAQLSLVVEMLLVCYSVPPLSVLSPGLPLFESILAHAIMLPLRVYCLAAHYEVDQLAVAASVHMLSFPLMRLTEDDACAMGAVYLRRLVLMHIRRVDMLRGLLLVPPAAHAPSAQCDAIGQQPKAQRAWELAVAPIVFDARPDTSQHALETALGPLLACVSCADCRRMLENCTRKLVTEWSAVKTTI